MLKQCALCCDARESKHLNMLDGGCELSFFIHFSETKNANAKVTQLDVCRPSSVVRKKC